MKLSWLRGIAGLAFLLLGYISTTKGDFATAGGHTVLGIIFAVMCYDDRGVSHT